MATSRAWYPRVGESGNLASRQRDYSCPICAAPVPPPMRVDSKDKNAWDCTDCGPHRMSAQTEVSLKTAVETDPEIRARLAEWVAEQRLCPEITLETISRLR